MTYPPVDYPWLWQWWFMLHQARNAASPECTVCSVTGDLVLVDRATGTDAETVWEDLAPACPRCADRIEQLVADRTAPGQRWEHMPRMVAVPAVIAELCSGRTPIDQADGDDPLW